MDLNILTEEQKAKLLTCQSPEELLVLAREEGMELSDEQLEGLAGGWGTSEGTSPECDSKVYPAKAC